MEDLKLEIKEFDDFVKLNKQKNGSLKYYDIREYINVMNDRFLDATRASFLLLENRYDYPAIMLIRSLIENTAIIFKLLSEINKTLDLNESKKIQQILYGTRQDNGIQSINILTLIENLDKNYSILRGFAEFYSHFSEYVHPNFNGVLLSYSDNKGRMGLSGREMTINFFRSIIKIYIEIVSRLGEKLI